jgi:hypothetical protein
LRFATPLLTFTRPTQPCSCARYILHLTYSVCRRNVLVNRVWLTPFSAPLDQPDLLKSTATNPPLLAPEPFMKIIIVITVVETLMLTLWLAYSYYQRRKLNLRIALGRPGPNFHRRDDSLLSPSPGHWSAINRSEVQGNRTTDGS